MKFYFRLISPALLICLCLTGMAQDPHFSQFYNSPLTLNPAMTGLMDKDLRLIANYKSQWGSVTVPYQTISASVDLSVLRGFLDDDFYGVGLMVLNDKAGDANYRTTQFQLSGAYSKSLGPDQNHYLSVGGQFGAVQRGVDFSALTFDSQFDGDILNPGIPSGEMIGNPQKFYLDFAAGLAWYFMPDDYTTLFVGGAMQHINEPNVSFFDAEPENLYRKYTIHASGEFSWGGQFSLLPNAVLLFQGPHQEINIGGRIKYLITEEDPIYMAISLGTMHRFKDAQVALVRFDYGPFGLAFSYDINISTLARASKSMGGPEFSLTYRTNFFQDSERSKRGVIKCPGL